MRPPRGLRLFLFLLLLLGAQAALAEAPALQYDPPAGFFGGGGGPPETWSSVNGDGLITIYPFQPFAGEFQRHFAQTLFAERIGQFRETRIVNPPFGDAVAVPGAEAAMLLRFVADHSGYVREHARLAVLSRGHVAVIDISSSSSEAWTRNWPGALGLLQSVRVQEKPSRPAAALSVAGPLGDVAGLYLGSTMIFQSNPTGAVGSGRWIAGTKWYLLSGDGRVQSGFKLPEAPNGDIRLFDYDAARRKDPGFGGLYSVEGGQVTLRLGNETVVADLTPEGHLVIRGTTYTKSKLQGP